MVEKTGTDLINKAVLLMSRVIKLNDAADDDVYYCYEFAGHVNAVIFAKSQKKGGEHTTVYRMTAYLDVHLGCTLDDIEEQITKEEQEDGTVSV